MIYSNNFSLDYYKENGFFIINNFLSFSQIKSIKKILIQLEIVEKQQCKEFIYSENVIRVWNLINKNILFQELIIDRRLFNIMELIFNRETKHQKFFLSSFQSTNVRPGAKAQVLHIDTPVPDPLPLWEIKANTIWLLDDFTENNGATEIIPSSHKNCRKPNKNNIDDHIGLKKIIASAGSLVIFSGYLWHRAGANVSSMNRRALLGSFASSAFREISSEEDIVRKSLLNKNFDILPECWTLVGGNHGIKNGID
jgi:ectoine hydroxylase-related dioxygenase (phytanoyl-CoA dioxygenase family)